MRSSERAAGLYPCHMRIAGTDERDVRLVVALCAASILSLPATANATGMSGVAGLIASIILGIPVGLLLLIWIIVSIVIRKQRKPWHPRYALVTMLLAPLLALVVPVVAAVFEPDAELVAETFLYDSPIIVLAVVGMVFAKRLLAAPPLVR